MDKNVNVSTDLPETFNCSNIEKNLRQIIKSAGFEVLYETEDDFSFGYHRSAPIRIYFYKPEDDRKGGYLRIKSFVHLKDGLTQEEVTNGDTELNNYANSVKVGSVMHEGGFVRVFNGYKHINTREELSVEDIADFIHDTIWETEIIGGIFNYENFKLYPRKQQKDDKSVLEKEEQECEDELKELILKAEKGLKEGLLSLMSEKDQKILSDIREGKWKDFDGEYKWNTSVDEIDMEVWEEQRSEWIIDSRGQSNDEPLATLWSELVSHCNDDEADDQLTLRDLREELLAHIDYVMGYRGEGGNEKLSVLQRNAAWSYGGCRSTDFRNWREELMNQFLEEQSFAGFDEIDEILNELWDEQHKEIHNKLEQMKIDFHQELLKEAWQMDEYEGHHITENAFDNANEQAKQLIDKITTCLMNREYNNEEYEAPDMDLLKEIRQKYVESTKVELTGKTVVISGDFKEITGLSQGEVKEALKKAGATVGSSVTKKTDLLIQGDGIGSKNAKAKELGIPIVEWSTLALA